MHYNLGIPNFAEVKSQVAPKTQSDAQSVPTAEMPSENGTEAQPTVDADGNVVNADAPAKKPKTTITVATNVPVEMKSIIDKVAEDAGKTPAVWLRELLAKTVNYELPPEAKRTRATNKYAGMTEAQKKEAQQKEQAEKRHKASALMAALEAGDLDIDLAAILAKYKPQTRAPRNTSGESAPEAEAATPASA